MITSSERKPGTSVGVKTSLDLHLSWSSATVVCTESMGLLFLCLVLISAPLVSHPTLLHTIEWREGGYSFVK